MAAIIRVKRKRDEDPAEALILACKKRRDDEPKTDTSSSPEITEVLKFAGTIPSKDVSVSSKIRDAIRKEKLQREYKRHSTDIHNRTRQHVRARSGRNRYQVITSHRAILLDSLDDVDECNEEHTAVDTDKTRCVTGCTEVLAVSQAAASRNKVSAVGAEGCVSDVTELKSERVFCLYDVENVRSENGDISVQPALPTSDLGEVTCNDMPMIRERVQTTREPENAMAASHGADFVYDLYYTNREGFDFQALERILRIEACGEGDLQAELVDDVDEEVYEDDDDSNDEGNWRNDYPDEDPDFYENEEDDFLNDDGLNQDHMLMENGYSLEDYMASRCNLEDAEDLSSDDDEEEDGCVQGPTTQRSYDSYLRSVKRELGGSRDGCKT
ncbi:probable RNA polymerase II nuclear localization protein SLC7A6OS [Liolophura sinensis]|uniref:probable RNA polymerase II nuclear localization protein SLC7A6OS n=1 Tax=Liolophura sinensis TaxID=3198878 RepID=UPI003158F8BE